MQPRYRTGNEPFVGELLQNGEVVVSDVRGTIDYYMRTGSSGPSQGWKGHFAMPHDAPPLDPGEYVLELEDGARHATIRIDRTTAESQPGANISFSGISDPP